MVNPGLLASVDALPLDERIELVEHINSTLAQGAHVNEADKMLIRGRADDADPQHWSTVEALDERIRARLA